MPRSISLNSVGVVQMAASKISGFDGNQPMTVEHMGATCTFRANRDYTELCLKRPADAVQDAAESANVTIERPQAGFGDSGLAPATVSWSSSSSRSTNLDDARLTAKLLEFAADVAAQLDEWAQVEA